jgi:UDP-N-acetylmuramate--alanine ligase
VEHDHPDLFPTEADYRAAFVRFVEAIPTGGRLIYCADDPGASRLAAEAGPIATVGYGLAGGEWRAEAMRPNQLGGTDFVIQRDDELVGLARLRVPGLHNVRNALAAVVVARALDVPFPKIRQSLGEFGGVGRRFQIVGQVSDVTVIDDYAHHPTEIRATLQAARQRFPEQRIWAVWQPHTFSRTKALLNQFATSFEEADRVVALAIYRSREQDDLGVDTPAVLRAMSHPEAHYRPTVDEAAAYILDRVRPGDVIITLTAGDGNRVGRAVLDALAARTGGRTTSVGSSASAGRREAIN